MTQKEIPMNIDNWICDQANQMYPYNAVLISDTDNFEYARNEAFGNGAEAMYRYLKSHTVEGDSRVLRWVKNTERLPEDGKEVVIRKTGTDYRHIVTREGVKFIDDYSDLHSYTTDPDFEWLDECAPSSSTGDGGEEAIALLKELRQCDTLSPYFIGKIDELLKP